MKNTSLILRILGCLFFCQVSLTALVSAQTVVVKGSVTTSTAPVRNASVTFEQTTNPANASSVLTDSTGKYQLQLTLTSVEPRNTLPATFELEQNYPNPFTTSTAIAYKLKTQEDIKVTIFDILGRVVRTMHTGTQSPGTHSILWDGSNASGHKVVPGVYFYSVQAGGQSQAKKMVYGSGSDGIPSMQLQYSSPAANEVRGFQRPSSGESFTVRIDTVSGTSPLINRMQIDNVVILGDTTLDYIVAAQNPVPIATVYMDSTQQFIRGFGAANILPWRPDMTADQVQKGFGAGPGQIGFSILRLRVPYTDDTTEFSANLPTASLAQSLGAIVFASPWTPPPALKSSDNIVGGMLNDSSYTSYAAHLKNFADYMARNSVPLYAVSLQNEPDANVTYESCSWNATQFLKFMKNNAASIGTRVMMPESQNFVHALSDSTLNDSAAAANVAIVAGHIYGGGLGPYPLAVSKGKEFWMTEHLVLDTSWTAVLATGREIHDCMSAGMNAYVWWYIVRYYGPIGEDGAVTKRGYVMSQYARFVRPGYFKIKCNATPQRNVWVSAYKDGTSSKVVIVAINTGASSVQQAFATTNVSSPSFSQYTTSLSKNCAKGSDIPSVNGSFQASLDPSSITTFISK
ncbi:MAG: FlgD immunoglobulin-like domain containing protein [Bacteroidota bacterium]